MALGGGRQDLPLPIMGPRLLPICRCQAVLGAKRTPEAAPGWMFLGLVLDGRRNRSLDHLLILRLSGSPLADPPGGPPLHPGQHKLRRQRAGVSRAPNNKTPLASGRTCTLSLLTGKARLYKFRIVEDRHKNTDHSSNTTVSLLDLT